MAAGWECPRCSLVLAPHVAEHRCDSPTAVVLQVPSPWPSSICVTSPNTSIATTGHLSVASGYITEVA